MKLNVILVAITLLAGLSGCQAGKTHLPITISTEVNPEGWSPDVQSGDELTFIGEYEPKENRIRFLDPGAVGVKSPRRLHWRIYFSVETGPHSLKMISRYLEPAEAAVLVKLPAVSKYIERVNASSDGQRTVSYPQLSLHEVYAGKVPQEFAKLDAQKTIVGVFCDNLGKFTQNLSVAYTVTPDRKPAPLLPGMVAVFTGEIHLNRPEFNYHQREEKKIHHFNLKLTGTRPIKVGLDEKTARRVFVEEINRAKGPLSDICKRRGLTFQFDGQEPTLSWVDRQIVMSDLITPHPPFSFEPLPYATVELVIDPETGKPERIVFIPRAYASPPD